MAVVRLEKSAQVLTQEIKTEKTRLLNRDRNEPGQAHHRRNRQTSNNMKAPDSAAPFALRPEKCSASHQRQDCADRSFGQYRRAGRQIAHPPPAPAIPPLKEECKHCDADGRGE